METYTTGTAVLEALTEAGVTYIFANLGSDHTSIVESLAAAKKTGKKVPQLITCLNEMVALSIAHGYAQVTGRAQAVLVHVECGTQALAGAVHNAAKGRVPVLILAGASPYTQEGEMKGSRNEFIQWPQDVFDQRGIVRGYMKYDNEIRTGKNVKQLIYRAMQFAHSEPGGPVYLMAAREVMEESMERKEINVDFWPALGPIPLHTDAIQLITKALLSAQKPLVVTSYLGRKPKAVDQLVALCDLLGVGVLDSVPGYINFPADHHMYQGVQWNEPIQNPVLAEADVVIILDSDIPWIQLLNKPSGTATVFHIDSDPLKEGMPLFQVPAKHVYKADVTTALQQLNQQLSQQLPDAAQVTARKKYFDTQHKAYRENLERQQQEPGEKITAPFFLSHLKDFLDENSIVLNEGITNYKNIFDYLSLSRPGSMITSGGGSLGWNGGAAIGVKLAEPHKTVVAITGDGSYMFSIPSSVHWIARKYQTPFLQIVLNNGGWNAPRVSALAVHPNGFASQTEDIGVSFDPSPDYGGIASASGGAFAIKVMLAEEVLPSLKKAFDILQNEKRAVVMEVFLQLANNKK
jgi:acetolactate synthase-1/2/3 large subunit